MNVSGYLDMSKQIKNIICYILNTFIIKNLEFDSYDFYQYTYLTSVKSLKIKKAVNASTKMLFNNIIPIIKSNKNLKKIYFSYKQPETNVLYSLLPSDNKNLLYINWINLSVLIKNPKYPDNYFGCWIDYFNEYFTLNSPVDCENIHLKWLNLMLRMIFLEEKQKYRGLDIHQVTQKIGNSLK